MDELALVRNRLRYEPETGELYWLPKENPRKGWNKRYANKPIRSISKGYIRLRIDGKFYAAHRVAWALYHGAWPNVIDHINGDKTDNRITNLRSVTNAENMRNLRAPKDNRSGHIGVSPYRNRWRALIGAAPQIYLGSFDTFEEAVAARKAAERRLGYHENHGKDLVA
jgi:hypothetical protein